MDPGSDIATQQQLGGAHDQVFEIELAALLLQLLVIVVEPGGERQRRHRRLEHAQEPQPVTQADEMVARLEHGVAQMRGGLGHRPGDQGGVGLRLAGLGEEDRFDEIEAPARISLVRRRFQELRHFLHGLAALFARQQDVFRERRAGQRGQGPEARKQAFLGLCLGKTQSTTQEPLRSAGAVG